MKNVFVSSALSLAVLLGAQLSASAQIVANGNFEANAAAFTSYPGYLGGSNPAAITDWVSSGNTEGINTFNGGTQGEGNPFAPTGYNSTDPAAFAFIQYPGNNYTLSQTINLAANTTYTLSFESAGRAGYSPTVANVSLSNNGVSFLTVAGNGSPSTDFTTTTMTFTTSPDLTGSSMIILDPSGPGNADTDYSNVSITEVVPEPATYALAGLGALALVFARRRVASLKS